MILSDLFFKSINLDEEDRLVDKDSCLFMLSCSVISDSAILWIVASQAPLSMGFPRQEYWSGLPFPSPGTLPNPGIEPGPPTLQVNSLLSQLYIHTYLLSWISFPFRSAQSTEWRFLCSTVRSHELSLLYTVS